MQRTITIVADDFGLTPGVTDTILETVDRGPVTRVSIIPNGEAVEYALEEYAKRSAHLSLAVHLNLTEGRALSRADEIPLLVDAAGNFKYGIAGLWAAYSVAGSTTRSRFREQIRQELTAQLARIRTGSSMEKLAVNGHQHVHLIPFVFDVLVQLPDIAEVRTIREPFQWCWSPVTLLAYGVLRLLSTRAARLLRHHHIATNDAFIGFLHSGHMTEQIYRRGLARAQGSVEVLFHPGSAAPGELASWRGTRADLAWHYSPWREREHDLLCNVTL